MGENLAVVLVLGISLNLVVVQDQEVHPNLGANRQVRRISLVEEGLILAENRVLVADQNLVEDQVLEVSQGLATSPEQEVHLNLGVSHPVDLAEANQALVVGQNLDRNLRGEKLDLALDQSLVIEILVLKNSTNNLFNTFYGF